MTIKHINLIVIVSLDYFIYLLFYFIFKFGN